MLIMFNFIKELFVCCITKFLEEEEEESTMI